MELELDYNFLGQKVWINGAQSIQLNVGSLE